MTNSNVLKDIECPDCGHKGPFQITVICFAEVHDDGIEITWDHEWDERAVCVCLACHSSNYVEYFQIQEEDEDARHLCTRI